VGVIFWNATKLFFLNNFVEKKNWIKITVWDIWWEVYIFCYDFLYKGTKNFFFMREITLKMKCLLSQFNVFSVKGVGGRLHLWTTEDLGLEVESIIEPQCSCPEFSGLPICCLFRPVRHILRRSNPWEKARSETACHLSILKVENTNLPNGPNLP